MGFYPYMKGKIERVTEKGQRKIIAEVFCSPLNKWTREEFLGDDPTEAAKWVAAKLLEVEM